MEHEPEGSRLGLPPDGVMIADCAALGVLAGEKELALFRTFATLVESRCRTTNLMGPNEMKRLWKRHFLESVAFAPLLEKAPVVDIGSGAGFPGIVLGILGWDVVLLEPRRKKALFLELSVERLGLSAVRVERRRLEDYRSCAAQFTARAAGGAGDLLEKLGRCSSEEAVLTVRAPGAPADGAAKRVVVLPVPPLDREGALVQYRVERGTRGS